MDNLTNGRDVGIDVSCDWLDLHCLPDRLRCRLPNVPEGHARCLIPRFDGVILSQEWKEALWEKFV
ncbi:hypothetical protein, partial [Puniceibacterium confluentis]|uniref:hypothetical protein n=1 Tax=Puniceibacterium confluentis TaxID=1958944 RepID=UPI001C958A38